MAGKISTSTGVLAIGLAVALTLSACSTAEDSTARRAPRAPSASAIEASPDAAQSTEPTAGAEADGSTEDQDAKLAELVEQAQTSIPQIMDATPGLYSEVRIVAVEPNTLSYEYVYAEQSDPEALSDYFDESIANFQSLSDATVFPEMVKNGITDSPKVRYVYVNSDGTEIWSHTFEQP